MGLTPFQEIIMRISVKVKPGSKQALVEKISDAEFVVRVREKALEGKANAATINLLSDYFSIARSNIRIIKGRKSRTKIFDIS